MRTFAWFDIGISYRFPFVDGSSMSGTLCSHLYVCSHACTTDLLLFSPLTVFISCVVTSHVCIFCATECISPLPTCQWQHTCHHFFCLDSHTQMLTHPCLHTHVHVHVCTHMHTHTCSHTPTHSCAHTYILSHSHTCTHMLTHTCVHTYSDIHVCTRTHMSCSGAVCWDDCSIGYGDRQPRPEVKWWKDEL